MNKLIDYDLLPETSYLIITDNRRERTFSTLSYAWSWLDWKKLRKVFTKDVVLIERQSPPICGLTNVLLCHSLWFDRLKSCLKKDIIPITLISAVKTEQNRVSLYIKESTNLKHFMFVFKMIISNDRISEVEIIHNDFVKIIRKHEEIDIETEFENIF